MRATLVLALALSASTTGPGRAEDGDSSAYKACLDKSEGITVNMRECQSAESERQDRKLNQIYQALMAKASKDQANELRSAQRAWIADRDASCRLVFTFGTGGTIDQISAGECGLDFLTRRIRFLSSLSVDE